MAARTENVRNILLEFPSLVSRSQEPLEGKSGKLFIFLKPKQEANQQEQTAVEQQEQQKAVEQSEQQAEEQREEKAVVLSEQQAEEQQGSEEVCEKQEQQKQQEEEQAKGGEKPEQSKPLLQRSESECSKCLILQRMIRRQEFFIDTLLNKIPFVLPEPSSASTAGTVGKPARTGIAGKPATIGTAGKPGKPGRLADLPMSRRLFSSEEELDE